MTPDQGDRQAELVASLAAVRGRIAAACTAAGRDQRTITMVAVTKTYPASDVATLVRLGVLDIGESKDQEATTKIGEVAELLAASPAGGGVPRWHFVGQLQRRKAKSVAGYATALHSLDRLELVGPLADAVARGQRRPLEIFVQISLDGDPDRGGAPAAAVPQLADAVAARAELELRGVMAVPPMATDPDAAFAALQEHSDRLQDRHPRADAISAGMSGDLEAALRHGATHLRVGTALLGRRDPAIG